MTETMSSAPDSIVCVDETALLRITGVARSTRRNWVKQSLIDDRSDGRYYEGDVVDTVLVALIVQATKGLDDARRVWHATRNSLVEAVADPERSNDLSLVIELRLLRTVVTRSAAEVGLAARPFEPLILIPISPRTEEAREAFRTFAAPPRSKPDGRRREATKLYDVNPGDGPYRRPA
jgi:hypothetical protein